MPHAMKGLKNQALGEHRLQPGQPLCTVRSVRVSRLTNSLTVSIYAYPWTPPSYLFTC